MNYEPRTLEEIVVGSERFNNEQKYKHTPVYKVGGKTKFAKRVANKKIRRSGKDNLENAYSGKSNDYRKENESWHILGRTNMESGILAEHRGKIMGKTL